MNEIRYALVVDDEPAIRKLTMQALEQQGFQCAEAGDGEEGQRMLATRPFEVLITDLRMPKRNGHALAVEVVAQDPRPLVVVLTGVLEPKLAADLIARGVDDIIFKPLDFRTFGAKIRALCDRKRKRERQAAPPASTPTPPAAKTDDVIVAELVAPPN